MNLTPKLNFTRLERQSEIPEGEAMGIAVTLAINNNLRKSIGKPNCGVGIDEVMNIHNKIIGKNND